eukprot:scaffold130052_cov22-Tisochrysis_lutea.AAC.1
MHVLLLPQAIKLTWMWCAGTPIVIMWQPPPATAACGCGTWALEAACASCWGSEQHPRAWRSAPTAGRWEDACAVLVAWVFVAWWCGAQSCIHVHGDQPRRPAGGKVGVQGLSPGCCLQGGLGFGALHGFHCV